MPFMTDNSHSRKISRELAQLAGKARDADDFRAMADSLVKKTVGWDFAVWSTVDPPTMLFTSCLIFGMKGDERIEQRLFDLEFTGDDVNLFTDLALSNQTANSMLIATEGSPESSRRYREFLQKMGCGDELRAVFKAGDITWGAVVAYRGMNSEPFSEADVALLSQIGGAVAEGLRHCLLRTAADVPNRIKEGPGLLLLDQNGETIETTPMAEQWISLVADMAQWKTVVRSLAASTRANQSPAILPIQTGTGQWLVLHSSPTDSGAVAIIVEEARGIHLTSVISNLYSLTPRERTVVEHVLQGRPTKDISKILNISTYTVQDHLKSIFDKVRVRSRRELVSLLFNQHYVERRYVHSIPGPYGWYLDDDCH